MCVCVCVAVSGFCLCYWSSFKKPKHSGSAAAARWMFVEVVSDVCILFCFIRTPHFSQSTEKILVHKMTVLCIWFNFSPSWFCTK